MYFRLVPWNILTEKQRKMTFVPIKFYFWLMVLNSQSSWVIPMLLCSWGDPAVFFQWPERQPEVTEQHLRISRQLRSYKEWKD